MTQPLGGPLQYERLWYGDIEVDARGLRPVVTKAPPLTRIALTALQGADITINGDGICIAWQVWYTPIEVDPITMTLICRKTRDIRSLVAQAKEDRAHAHTS